MAASLSELKVRVGVDAPAAEWSSFAKNVEGKLIRPIKKAAGDLVHVAGLLSVAVGKHFEGFASGALKAAAAVDVCINGMHILKGAASLAMSGPLGLITVFGTAAIAIGAAVAGMGGFGEKIADATDEAKALSAEFDAMAKKHPLGPEPDPNLPTGAGGFSLGGQHMGFAGAPAGASSSTRKFFDMAEKGTTNLLASFNKLQPAMESWGRAGADILGNYGEKMLGLDRNTVGFMDKTVKAAFELQNFRGRMSEITAQEEVLGDAYDSNAASLQAVQQAMIGLRTLGIDPASEAYQKLQALLPGIKQGIADLHSPTQTFIDLVKQIPPLTETIGKLLFNTVQGFTDAVGEAVGQALAHGKSFTDTFGNLLDSLGAKIISTIVSTLITQIIFGNIAAYSDIPFVGLLLGIAAAGAAIAAGHALTSKHKGKNFAEGGFATGLIPIAGVFGEAGPEVVYPLDRFERVMGLTGRGAGWGGVIHVHLNLDGKEITDKVLRLTPERLRLHGAG